jgi:serine/threonine protein kinase
MRPTVFGKYTLLERISHGGMAEVFRAKTFGAAGFERIVAIKLLLPTVASDQDFITMLIDEAKIAGQLSHANIAQIFDLGQIDGRYFIVQEYVAGRDLRAILGHLADQNATMAVAQACHIILRVCEGLDYAHNKRDQGGNLLNLVHRDISPQNVIVSYDGEVKLIDFGIAKAEGRATRTLAGLVKGKFAYMSPEQIRGLPVDRRSDVFACGIVLHELLTGRPLFKRQSDFETLKRARNAEIEPPSQLNPSVPPELDSIVLRSLARHVDDRFPSAVALRDALWAFVSTSEHGFNRNQLASWMRGEFPVADGHGGDGAGDGAGDGHRGDGALDASSIGPADPSGAFTLPEGARRSRRRPEPEPEPDEDDDEGDNRTVVDPELMLRISSEAMAADHPGLAGDLVDPPQTAAPTPSQPHPANPAAADAPARSLGKVTSSGPVIEYRTPSPSQPPPERTGTGFEEETTSDRAGAAGIEMAPSVGFAHPVQPRPDRITGSGPVLKTALPLKPRDLADSTPAPLPAGGPVRRPRSLSQPPTDQRPSMQRYQEALGASGPLAMENQPRDDLDPMLLDPLRSTGDLIPRPSQGFRTRAASAVAAPPKTAARPPRLLIGAAVLLLLAAAAASLTLSLTGDDAPEPAAATSP